MAPQSEIQKIDGTVIEALPNTQFRVKLPDDKVILAHLAGRMRLNRIRVMPGDRVTIELTPYDDSKGRIVYRNK
ncbi:MAG: Translation initiation factor IF-1 [Microgenomates group bacterium ADurb.Bin238]|jgi:translation initiation factor IF-1|uniref:Translation initiation factor IF-1 n=1 Tax=Candidatus Chazhemtobacterium aquaticus TaxID=2715735 RepID=A0A857N7F3_9BACT|nr:translation initiation factor IF-1 [Candidatus Chazhemtobacterium aquaticus]OQA82621.1 MAG: Translation initiation factor IF-1 [Microgenomates group bacterium ADurb.Bin238]QHO63309.1 Translation initiation factor 1 [Candidatus Chazhemtobacterium aquaticus]